MFHSHFPYKRAPAASAAQVVGASAWTYTNSSASAQILTVVGGVVTSIEINLGPGFVLNLAIAGVFTLFPAQQMRITYVVTPPTVGMVQL